jgi:hypothetical protein
VAVVPMASPFISGAVPPSAARLQVIAAFGSLGSLAMAIAEIVSLGVAGDGRQENPFLRWDRLGGRDEVKLVYYMMSVRLHVRCPSCGPCSSRGPGRSTLRGVRSWMKGDAEGRALALQETI